MKISILIVLLLSAILCGHGTQTCYQKTGSSGNIRQFWYYKNSSVSGIFQVIKPCSDYSPLGSFNIGMDGCSPNADILDWYIYFIDMNETDWQTNQDFLYNSSLGIFEPNVDSQFFSMTNYNLTENGGCNGDVSFISDNIYLTKYHSYAVYIVKRGEDISFATVPLSESSNYEKAFTLENCQIGNPSACIGKQLAIDNANRTFFIRLLNDSITNVDKPTVTPSYTPSNLPTDATNPPSYAPSNAPSLPTRSPTVLPTKGPVFEPTFAPSNPTVNPTFQPTNRPSDRPTLSPTEPTDNPTSAPTSFGECSNLKEHLTGNNYLLSVNAQVNPSACNSTVNIEAAGDYIKQYVDFGNELTDGNYYFLKQINVWIDPVNTKDSTGYIQEYYISLKAINNSKNEIKIADTLTYAVEQTSSGNSNTFNSFAFKEIGLLNSDITNDESNIDYFIELILTETTDSDVQYPIYTCNRDTTAFSMSSNSTNLATSIFIDNSTYYSCLNDVMLGYEIEYSTYYRTYDMKATIESIITADEWTDDYRWNLQDAASRAFLTAMTNLTGNDCENPANSDCDFIVVCDNIEEEASSSRRLLQTTTTYTVGMTIGASMSSSYYTTYLSEALSSFDTIDTQFDSIFSEAFESELNNYIDNPDFDTTDSSTFIFSIDSVGLIDLSSSIIKSTNISTDGTISSTLSATMDTPAPTTNGKSSEDSDDSSNEFVDLTSGDFFTVLGEAAINGLESDFATQLLFVIACLSFSLIIFGMVHNCATGTDSFDLWAIFFYALLTWDFFSDVFFAYQLYVWNSSSTTDTQIYSLMLYLSIGFVVVPLSLNLRALLRAQGDWSRHRVLGDRYRRYLNECGRPLFFLSILSGSAFATVHLINSNLFGWRIFSMGLSKQEITEFDQKRLINSIVLENIPQLCLQFWFAFQSDAISFVIMMAMLSSAISIMSAIWDHLSRRQTSDYQNISTVLYTVKVTSPFIRESRKNRNKFVHRRWKLQIELSELFGIDKTSVEVLQPSKFRDAHRGNGLIVNFWIVTTAISEDKLEQMMTDDYMMPDDKRGKQNTPSLPPSQLEQIRRQGNCPFARAVYSAWNRSLRAELGCVEAFDFQWANKFGGHTIRKDDNLGIMLSSSAFSESGTSPRAGGGTATNNTTDTNGDTFGRTETGSTARLTDADALIAATNTSVKKSISQREGPKYDDNNTNNGSLAHPMTQMTNVASASSGSISGRDDDDDDAMIPTSEYKNIKPAKKGDAMNELEIQIMGDK